MNTAIIHSYSTLPRNGHIQGVKPELPAYTRLSDMSVLLESAKFEDKRPNWLGSEELKPILGKSLSIVRNHPGCPTLIGTMFRYAHLVPKGSESIRRKTLGHSIFDIVGCRYLLEADFP